MAIAGFSASPTLELETFNVRVKRVPIAGLVVAALAIYWTLLQHRLHLSGSGAVS